MIELSVGDIAQVVGGTLAGGVDPTLLVIGPVEFDSRKVQPGGIFVALRGVHVDGHDFARQAVTESGAAVVLAARDVGVPAIIVPHIDNPDNNAEAFAHDPTGQMASVLAALSTLARHNTEVAVKHGMKVIGITGSVGKTSTKDFIASVLRKAGETVAPPGSFNNEIGHPYTALRCTADTDFLVAELSARGIGHIAHLASIAPPNIGVVLNVGSAHVGEFGSVEVIAQAKGELVESLPAVDGVAILNLDDPLVAAMAQRTQAKVVYFSTRQQTDYYASDITITGNARPSFMLHTPTAAPVPVTLQVFGAHQVANAVAAAAVGMEVGLSPEQVAQALSEHTAASAHRMDVKTRGDGVTIIDDAYNANPDSMRAGIEAAMAAVRNIPGARCWAVLGQMNELGEIAMVEHQKLAIYLAEQGVDKLIAVGNSANVRALAAAAQQAGLSASVVANTTEAAQVVGAKVGPNDVVVVKASYSDQLWHVAEELHAQCPSIDS